MKTPVHRIEFGASKSLDYFHLSLRASGLLSESQIETLLSDCPARTVDAQQAWLISQGWLTRYQADRLLDNRRPQLTLGPYVIQDEIGQGSFGKVYKAIQTVMNRVVALKVIDTNLVSSQKARDLFLREVVGLTSLSHPNISFAYDANQQDGTLYLAMEFVDGPTLKDYISEHGPMPIPLACEVMLQIAHALTYTHEKGVVHRDIKPPNLLLPGFRNGTREIERGVDSSPVLVKIIDFGLARLYLRSGNGIPTLKHDGDLIGTPEFMSPEQVRNYHHVDIRSDLYSAGCSFYFALTGRVPITGDTVLQTIMQQIETEPEPITKYCPGISPEIASVVHRLMAKNPDDRFQTPAEFAAALGPALVHYRQAASAGKPQIAYGESDSKPENYSSAVAWDEYATPMEFPAALHPPIDETNCPTMEQVLDLWDRWRLIVGGLVRGSQSNLTDAQYRPLYGELMQSLKARRLAAAECQTELFLKLETVVEPWLTLRSLLDLDTEMKSCLSRTCQTLNGELTPMDDLTRSRWPIGIWSALAIAIAVGVGVFLVKLSGRM